MNRDSPYCIAVSLNGKRFAFGSRDGMIRVWDEELDVHVCGPFAFDGKGYDVCSLIFSPDSRHIASRSDDIRVWDAETGEMLFGPFTAYTEETESLAYSPDGRHIAASADFTLAVRIWNMKTGNCEVLEGRTDSVRFVAYSPDGSHIVSSGWDNEIRVWDMRTSKVLMPSYQDQLLASTKIDISKWTLDKDGWIRGAHDELLLWVPPDLRPTLCCPPNIAVLNVEFSTALDFSGSAQGERWHECFHPLV